ncbi:hypothetical protein [Neolewinella sp.]|uniref:hypothetical protein n=1 Tax=Neolewinella sp. TaxID=2993543 RepID=UPI003B5266F3
MKKSRPSPPPKAWFRCHQRHGVYNFYEVIGGPGKTKDGYLTAIHFLSSPPQITVQHNYEHDRSGLTGTWCHYEASEEITEAAFTEALDRALDCGGVIVT